MTLSPLSFGIYLHLSHCHVTSLSPVLHVIVCVEFWSGLYFNPISVSLGVYMCVCVGCSQNNWLPVTCSMSCGGGQQHVFTPGFNIPLHTHTHSSIPPSNSSLQIYVYIKYIFFVVAGFCNTQTDIRYSAYDCVTTPIVSGLVTAEGENGTV